MAFSTAVALVGIVGGMVACWGDTACFTGVAVVAGTGGGGVPGGCTDISGCTYCAVCMTGDTAAGIIIAACYILGISANVCRCISQNICGTVVLRMGTFVGAAVIVTVIAAGIIVQCTIIRLE